MNDCTCWKCCNHEATEAEYLTSVCTQIDRYGWLVQGVRGTRLHTAWAYTVGLTEYGVPELVITGRRLEVAASMLNAVAKYTLDEVEISPGETMHLGEVYLEAVALPHPGAHLFRAAAMYGDRARAVQMVWSDERGRLPWERGHRGGRGGQPVLGPRHKAMRTA